MKHLVVCCDGTWNRPDHIDRGVAAPTNVAKLALALADEDAAGNHQLLHYQAGVGTRTWERLLGGGFGVGLSRNVMECYRFVVDNYEPEDELYFFGFSRGAFTARSLAGLVRNSGILKPGHRDRIAEAYKLYRSPRKDTQPTGIAAELFRRAHSYSEVYIQCVGVWDTVGALGIPIDGFRPPLLSRLWTFHDTRLSRYVRNAFHAVAVDERRKPFAPTLWTQQADAEDQRLVQTWFAGVHCDIGGGYREPELSELALQWMADNARSCGLAFRPGHLVVKTPADPDKRREGLEIAPDPLGTLHNSRTRFYRLLPPYDRAVTGEVDPSVRTRYEQEPMYRPPGLEA